MDNYNPFDDFDKNDVFSYLKGEHIPSFMDKDVDDASIFYVENIEIYYDWFNRLNGLNDKSLKNVTLVYQAILNSDEKIEPGLDVHRD